MVWLISMLRVFAQGTAACCLAEMSDGVTTAPDDFTTHCPPAVPTINWRCPATQKIGLISVESSVAEIASSSSTVEAPSEKLSGRMFCKSADCDIHSELGL